MKKAALYVRVSTEEQKKHGLSVDSQISALTDYCSENNYKIVKIYNDAGISARKRYTKRPALLQLIEDCKSKKIDIILFTKLDRWFRSVGDYYEVQSVLDQYQIPWRAIWEDYETETSSGVFKVNIMLSVAQSEADRTSERIKSVVEYKKARGEFLGGVAPAGYINQNKSLAIDESTHDAIMSFFNTYAETCSITEARNIAMLKGVKLSTRTASNILHNPTYYGDHHGHKCPAYITREQFDKNQIVMKRHTRTPVNHRIYLFSGLFRCKKCGNVFAAHYSSYKLADGTVRGRVNYICVGHKDYFCDVKKHIDERKIELILLDKLGTHLDQYKVSAHTQESSDNSAKIELLQARLSRVGDRYEDGDIDRDTYKSKREQILDEIEQLRSVKPNTPIQLPDNWREAYIQLDRSHRKMFWNRIIDRIVFSEDDISNPTIFYK